VTALRKPVPAAMFSASSERPRLTSREGALGTHDACRMQADYELVRDTVGFDRPFDVKTAYTNEFLDRSIRMPK
jgi:hypothetical protein